MSVLGTGRPRTESTVKDNSIITVNDGAGVTAVLGITEMGNLNEPVIVKNYNDFLKKFGGLVSYSNFPLYCKRALDAGAVLMVSRLARYTDISNRSSAVGMKATRTSNGATFTAKNIGSWGNEITVELTENVNYPTQWNVTVSFRGITETRRLSKTPTEAELSGFNSTFLYVDITAASTLTAGTVTLSGGSEDYSDFSTSDIIGDVQARTGLHSFDSAREPIRISPMEFNNPEVETYFTNWAKVKGDILCIFPSPTNIQASEAVDYRERTGSYSGFPPIDYWGAVQIFGDIEINDPSVEIGTQEVPTITISAIGDFIGAMGNRDKKTKGEVWKAFSFYEYGRLSGVLDVPYNVGSSTLSSEADRLSNHRINYVINHESWGATIWDVNTLQKADTLLKNVTVAELMINILRTIKPLAERQLGKPNRPETWRKIYTDIAGYFSNLNSREALQNELVTGTGEGDSWYYEGDQAINDFSELTVNNLNDIDNGIYRFRVFFKPASVLRYIGYELSVTNSGVKFSVIS